MAEIPGIDANKINAGTVQPDAIAALVDWQMTQQPVSRTRRCPRCRTEWIDPDGTTFTCGDCGYDQPVPSLPGSPATSNITVGEMVQLLLAHDQSAPLLVLFDNQAGVASELFVISELSDPPDWADPRTIYIDAHGG